MDKLPNNSLGKLSKADFIVSTTHLYSNGLIVYFKNGEKYETKTLTLVDIDVTSKMYIFRTSNSCKAYYIDSIKYIDNQESITKFAKKIKVENALNDKIRLWNNVTYLEDKNNIYILNQDGDFTFIYKDCSYNKISILNKYDINTFLELESDYMNCLEDDEYAIHYYFKNGVVIKPIDDDIIILDFLIDIYIEDKKIIVKYKHKNNVITNSFLINDIDYIIAYDEYKLIEQE